MMLNGQGGTENLSGKVSFVSSQNIYTKFRSTAGINEGDTLFISSEGKLVPALVVKSLSSISCVCIKITDIDLPVDHLIIARISIETEAVVDKAVATTVKDPVTTEIKSDTAEAASSETSRKQLIRGSVSVNSYTDISNTAGGNSQRFRYSLSLDARNIAGSKFSFSGNMSFRHKAGEWAEVDSSLFNALKIYNLGIRYDLNKTTGFFVGRRINPRIASMGAMDGIQLEKSVRGFTFGILAGTRPDYATYGLNTDLIQYGGFVSLDTKSERSFTGSSIAFVQQMNKSATDRRFLYFQHSGSPVKNLYYSGSFEIDLFKLENDVPKSTLDLTGAYLSLRVNVAKGFSLSGSYDARKNVIYYETYNTFTDRILENELRQGFRLNANWRTANNMMFGLQSGYRFLKSDPRPSANIHGYFTYSRVPVLNISATVSATYLESAHMTGKIAGLRLSRDFSEGKVQAGMGYHFVDYTLPETTPDVIGHTGEADLYLQVFEKLTLGVNYEVSFESQDVYNRIYIQVRRRF
jgi:hypothetical protein